MFDNKIRIVIDGTSLTLSNEDVVNIFKSVKHFRDKLEESNEATISLVVENNKLTSRIQDANNQLSKYGHGADF